jgi:acyl-CoA dehydrogenase family protein 9
MYYHNIKIIFAGIQHAGVELQETVKKLRNPLMNPNFVIYKTWQRRQHLNDSPKLNLGLDGYLHPSLQVLTAFFLVDH